MEAVEGSREQDRSTTMFFVRFEVEPTEHNPQYDLVKSADACCLVLAENEPAAFNTALFYIERDEWTVTRTNTYPVEVGQVQFGGDEIWLSQFHAAQQEEIGIVYGGWARDGKTAAGPMPLERSRDFDLNAYIGKQKQLARKGRCLHYNDGIRCGAAISAYSIQKNGQLSAIADNGHVYTFSRDVGTIKKNNGRLTLERCGVRKVSTFRGFCDEHDSRLFSPIDTNPLLPTDQQVVLYA
jgi:hypothetical protein